MQWGERFVCWVLKSVGVCLLLLCSPTANSSEPPPFPGLNEAVPNQCTAAISQFGPEQCVGVLLPTSWAADCILWEEYAIQLQNLYRVDTDLLEAQLENLQHELVAASYTPWNEQPHVQRWAGRAEGLLVGVLAGALIWELMPEK